MVAEQEVERKEHDESKRNGNDAHPCHFDKSPLLLRRRLPDEIPPSLFKMSLAGCTPIHELDIAVAAFLVSTKQPRHREDVKPKPPTMATPL